MGFFFHMGQQAVPGRSERLGAFALQALGKRIGVNARRAACGNRGIRADGVVRQGLVHFAVLGKGQQRFLRQGVDGVRRGQRVDVERVGRRRVLGAGAGPQQALRAGAGSVLLAATSQRLTNSDATEGTRGLKPAAMRRSMPRR